MFSPIRIDRTSSIVKRSLLFATALLLGLAVGAGISLLRAEGLLQNLEFLVYDKSLALHQPRPAGAPEIVLVAITEADIQGLARWPLTDERLASLLEAIASHAPAAVGLDIFRDQPVGEGLAHLNDVLARIDSIVAVFSQPTPGSLGVPPPPALADRPSRIGFANVMLDPDGKVRRAFLLMSDERHGAVYSLPAQLAFRYLQTQDINPEPDPIDPHALKLGQGTLRRFRGNDGSYVDADDGEYQYLFDFRDVNTDFPVVDMWSVLQGDIPADLLTGKIVLLGVTAESVKDQFLTPVSSVPVYGIELHAQTIAQLLRTARHGDEPVRSLPEYVEYSLIMAFGLLGAVVGVRIRRSALFLAALAIVVTLLPFGGVIGVRHGFWIPVAPPTLAWLGSALASLALVAGFERRERAQIYRLFSRFCSREVVDEIRFRGGEHIRPGKSTALQGTVMFTDIVGFARIAEHLARNRLMVWLNEYVSVMMPLVYEHQGIVIRLVGDAIMAAYGVPIPRTLEQDIEMDARRAVLTALAMDKALLEFNNSRKDPMERVAMRIGIATGTMAGGVLGDSRRQEYNIHGDVVNIAARVEQIEKESFEHDVLTNRTRILVTGETLRQLGNEFSSEFYGDLHLRNRSDTTRVYRILGDAPRDPSNRVD